MRRGPRVLVTDAEHRSVLAACRGLGAAGFRVSTVADDRFALAHWSRFSDERITVAGPRLDPDDYVECLARLLRRDTYDVVIPGTELSLLPISARRDLIEPHARLGLPAHDILLDAVDKPLLQRRAAAVGLAPPKSVVCLSADEAVTAASSLAFPVIVKPTRSVGRPAGEMVERPKGEVVVSAADIEAAVALIGAPVVLQEYARGASIVSYAGVRVDGRLLGLTVARYSRTYPADIGSAALAVTVAPCPRLTGQVEELLAQIGWCGIFELELLDLGGGRFGAIDFNPRPFGWMQLAIGAGANLPALWCDHLLGRRTVPPDWARAGVSYRWEDADLRNAVARLRCGRVGEALAVLRPHARTVHAVFKADDPAPALARALTVLDRLTGSTLGRWTRRRLPTPVAPP